MDLPRSAPRDILVPEVHPDERETMHDHLTEHLLRRARKVARYLRMDTLGDVHVQTVEGSHGKYWRFQAESTDGAIVLLFYLWPSGRFQIGGSFDSHVPPPDGEVGESDQAHPDVLGDGSRPTVWADSLSQLSLFT